MTSNQIEYWKLQETKRSNQAKEAETMRHNLADEAVRSNELAEGVRHNLVVESETQRHNSAMDSYDLLSLAEGVRTHQANEAIGRSSVGLGYAELGEKQRHNERDEAVQEGKLKLNVTTEMTQLKNAQRELQIAEKNAATNEARNSIEMLKAYLGIFSDAARLAVPK